VTAAAIKPAHKPWTAADLRAWRVRLDLSQPAAAEALGLSVDTLRDYEYERRRVGRLPPWLARLCLYYERFGGLD
jgi:DNA-binding transcriptional regulator YiaG